jgi:hypothetical protein
MTDFVQPSLSSGQPKSAARSVLIALAILVLMMGGMYVMRLVSQEAVVEVQTDQTTAALLQVRDVMLVRTDGPERYPLRAGRQSVRAGQYKIEVPADPEATELEFTPANFQAKTGEQVSVEVTAK